VSYAEQIEPLLRTTMEVLRDADRPMPPREVMKRVGEQVEVPAELTLTNDSGQIRWQAQLGFRTGEARAIGWLTKRDGWSLTEAGRQALENYPGIELYLEMKRQYQVRRQPSH
jgi:5-methylcytosine-specific restriction protein B